MIVISGKSHSGKTNKLISFIKGNYDKNFFIISTDMNINSFVKLFGDDIKSNKGDIVYHDIKRKDCIEERIIHSTKRDDFDFIVIDQIREDEIEKYKELIEQETSAEAVLIVQEKLNQGCSRVDILRKDLLKNKRLSPDDFIGLTEVEMFNLSISLRDMANKCYDNMIKIRN